MSSLGEERQWVYPLKVKGTYQRIHRYVSGGLFAVLLVTPWIEIGGHPALLADLWARRLYVAGNIFTPRDTIFLVLIGLFVAFSLFFFTSLYGRMWCGYACPQTVFLEELIRPIEERIEGSRGKRMARDRGPWTVDKAWRKALKWTVFAGVAGFVSMSLASIFVRPMVLWTGQAPASAYAVTASIGAMLFIDFAWFRDQFCSYLCPYARFQGALTDDQSLVIQYDTVRGEPRGNKRKQKALAAAGEPSGGCIDCKKCVSVCPQGIDIRNGYQLECINCARCVDACEDVMGRLGQPSLVRYSTAAEDRGEQRRVLRPRTVAYGVLLTGIAATFFGLLLTHHEIDATVNRAPGSLYTIDEDGFIRNTFLLQVENNHGGPNDPPTDFAVSISGLDGAELVIPPLALESGESRKVPLVIRVPLDAVEARTVPMVVEVSTAFDTITVETTFKANTKLEG